MNLALHQLRLELRRSRFGFGLYLLVLLCNYAVAAGWVGLPDTPEGGHWNVGGPLPTLFLIAYWIAFAMVVSTCVLADSPARRDRFLQTRPLPGSSLFLAKALFVLLAAILPAVLVEAASVATVGGPAALVLLAALERFVLCTVLALALAAFAAHWKNTQGFILASLIGFVAVMIVAQLVVGIIRALGGFRDPFDGEPTYLTLIQALLILAIGLGVTAWICTRRGRKFRYLIPAFLPVCAAGMYILGNSPLRTAPVRPGAQVELDELLTDGRATAEVVSRGFIVGDDGSASELHTTYSFTPVTTGIPSDLELRWSPLNHRWLVDGKVARRDYTDPHRLASSYVSQDHVPVSWALAQTIQNHVGKNAVFRLDQSASTHAAHLSSYSLRYRPTDSEVGKEARVQTSVVGDAFRWQVAADLPLFATQPKTGRWAIAKVASLGEEVTVLLTETTVAAHTSGDLNHRTMRGRWGEQLPLRPLSPLQGPGLLRRFRVRTARSRCFRGEALLREDPIRSPVERRPARLRTRGRSHSHPPQ